MTIKNKIQYIDKNVIKYDGFNDKLSSIESEIERVDNVLALLNRALESIDRDLPAESKTRFKEVKRLADSAVLYSGRAKKISQGQKVYRVLKVY